MKALVFNAIGDIRYEEVAEPELGGPNEAIVEIRHTAICGSDLHVYRGKEVGLDPGTVMGHEFVGEIVETGSEVGGLPPGTLVVSPFTTSCGECFFCERGLTARCSRGQFFGWVERGAGLHGAQAELVRVPLAESTLVRVPADLDSEIALFAGDVLATGMFCAELAAVTPGTVAVVLGCGAVGLMAVVAAVEAGAGRVFAVDRVPERLVLAESFGAEPLTLDSGALIDTVLSATGGRGADCILEAVGTPEATRLAVDLVRPGGTIGAIGVHTEQHFAFPPGEAYDKNLTYRAGRCSARRLMGRALDLARRGIVDLASVISHRLPLAEGPGAYKLFEQQGEGCTKVLLDSD